MAKHALLSASSASRWLNCPKSVRLTEDIPDGESSSFAAEGTLAHAIAEDYLREYATGKGRTIEDYTVPEKFKGNPLFYEGMYQDVTPYLEYVTEAFESKSRVATLDIEARLDFSKYVPSGFGTGDAVIIDNGTLEICDLKFGKGVLVEAENNPQIMLYGLGALHVYDYIFEIKKVKMTIVQPRLNHVASFELSADDLRAWGHETVSPIAKLAYNGQGDQKAGEWCRWCKIKATCKARAEKQGQTVAMMAEAELNDEQICQILTASAEIKAWLSDVEANIVQRLSDGGSLTGWKLVEGRSNRKIKEPEALADKLLNCGVDASHIYKPQELQSLTVLEKAVGKARFNELYGEYVYKPQGKATLVPESDKRPALGSVENDFNFEEMGE
nr:MAG TPA: PD-(D/E)XK nuclease superfamily protein [Caudoviricetes sp.]